MLFDRVKQHEHFVGALCTGSAIHSGVKTLVTNNMQIKFKCRAKGTDVHVVRKRAHAKRLLDALRSAAREELTQPSLENKRKAYKSYPAYQDLLVFADGDAVHCWKGFEGASWYTVMVQRANCVDVHKLEHWLRWPRACRPGAKDE